jgi:cell filamentation protein
MSDPVYCCPPDFVVLRNKLDFRDADQLALVEAVLVSQRIAEGIPSGGFDLAHLKAIHRHLFQDVYEWAGQIRTVEISKGGNRFQFRRYIETGMADVDRRLLQRNFLKGLDAETFSREAGPIIGDVNYVHPFRDGNGRVQVLYLEQLANRAGHRLDLTRIDKDAWIAASSRSHFGNYDALAKCIAEAIVR